MKKGNENIKQWFLILSSFLVGSIITLILVMTLSNNNTTTILSSNKDVISSLDDVYDSTVYIKSVGEEESEGSGFIYKTDKKYAYVLTNEHVLTSKNIKIINNKKKEAIGTILGKDAYLDLAVVRIEKKYALKTTPVEKNYNAKIGEKIYVIGTPISENYQGTVTSGIISGKNRVVKTSINGNEGNWAMNVLQFDAAINPGNSGGPVVNEDGKVIGICTMKLNQGNIDGMAFAIPSEDIWKNITILEEGQKIERPELGITVVDLDNYKTLEKNNVSINGDCEKGTVIISVKDKSIANNNGLQKGDIITKVNGEEIKDTAYFKYELYKYNKGDIITLTYIREEKEKTISITL